jgi:hypothetical protein
MSTLYLCLFPSDPYFAPDDEQRKRAVSQLADFVLLAGELEEELSDHPEFVDPGGNWEGVECPRCRRDLDDWWPDTMRRAKDSKFEDLRVRTPCCALDTTLNDLHYRWPAGFARYVLSARDPRRDPSESDLHELEITLGTAIKRLWRRV